MLVRQTIVLMFWTLLAFTTLYYFTVKIIEVGSIDKLAH